MMISGGCVPGGKLLKNVCEIAVVCPRAVWMLAPG